MEVKAGSSDKNQQDEAISKEQLYIPLRGKTELEGSATK